MYQHHVAKMAHVTPQSFEKVIAPFLREENHLKMVLIKSTIGIDFARSLEAHMELQNTSQYFDLT